MILIKKRNFKPYLLNWLIPELGVGTAIGEIFYVAEAGSAMENQLKVNGIPDSEIYHSLVTVEDAMTTGRNDVALVCPGIYTETVETDWDKTRCHMVGLDGPQQKGYESGTGFYTETATVGAVLHNTGTRCRFHNVTFANAGAAATALTAFKNDGYGTRLKGCQFIGMMGATACDTALASSLEITASGYYFYAEDCQIGSTDWQVQGSSTNAPLLFSAATGVPPSDGKFVRCNFSSRIADATRPLIYVAAAGVDRDWIFDQCEFYAFAVNHAVACNQVISDACTTTHDILFKNCAALNCTAIKTTASAHVWAIGGRELDHIQGVAYPSAAA